MKFGMSIINKSLLAMTIIFGVVSPQALAQQTEKIEVTTEMSAFDSPQVFTVSRPVFTNYQGETIQELTANGFLKTSVTIKNETNEAKQATLIFALFGATGSMENVAYVDKLIGATAEETFNAGFTLPANIEGKYAKVFVWNSFAGMQPLSNAYTFPDLDDNYENVALGKPYTVAQGFGDKDLIAYETRTSTDNGTNYELTDGKIATITAKNAFQDKNWTGFNRQINRSVVIDLEEPKFIDSITGGYLQERSAAVELPRYIKYALSMDNVNWYSADQQNPVYSDSQSASRKEITLSGIKATARYVKIEFEVGMFTFVDEIKVMGRNAKSTDRAVTALPIESAPVDAAPPTLEETGGVKHMYIAYYYPTGGTNEQLGRWHKDDFKSVIAHTDAQGSRTGWLFDTILFSNGGDVYSDYNTKEKWQTYLDQLFADNQHIAALNDATADAKTALNAPGYKTKVVVSIPYPNPTPDAVWGQLDGKTVDFDIKHGEEASFEARKKAVDWYVDTTIQKFAEKSYANVELAGFYWQHEEVGYATLNEENLVKHISAKIHNVNKKFFWIPFFQSNGSTIWKELGFDAVMMQPNYYFNSSFGPNSSVGGKFDLSRLQTTIATAKRFGMGVEVEGDYHMTWPSWGTDWDGQLYNGDYATRKYFAYLNEYKRDNLDQTITGYYMGARTVLPDIYNSNKPSVRSAYDETARFVNGQYQIQVLDETEIPLPLGDTWDKPIEVNAAEGDVYTSYVDVSSSKWIKFPIKAGEDWMVTLTPLNGSKFGMETRHWGASQTQHSGFSYNKSSEVQSMLVKNPGTEDTFIMLRVFPDDSTSGKFKISLQHPTEDGTSMMNAIDLFNETHLTGNAAQAGQSIWYKVSGMSSYNLHLVPSAGTDFDIEWYWDANSGVPQGKSTLGVGQTETLTINNSFAPKFLYYIKVIAKTTGSYELYNGVTPPDLQPVRGNTYADAIAIDAAEGQVYNSATLNEGVSPDLAKWLKFPVAPGEKWEITLTPASGSQVAMETRWVEGAPLGYTYSWMSEETQPKSLTIDNQDATQKYAYIRTLAQQTGGNYTISLHKIVTP